MNYYLKDTLVELYLRNYATLNGFVKSVDRKFEDYTKINSKSLIWIKISQLKKNRNRKLVRKRKLVITNDAP
jgi:hypothetical protein